VITSETVFASRGYTVDQPLVVIAQDMPNTMTDNVAMTPLANLVTDAARAATGADVALSGNGMMREGLLKGNSGIQTVYDVFSVAPLGNGIVDSVAGSALVTAYFTGRELKDLLEFLLVENPTHPGEFFPRTSGMRFRYDRSRPKFDVVTAIELGDFDSGYQPIDIVGRSDRLYSLTCPLYLGAIMATVPDRTNGALAFVPKTRDGRPLTTRVDALERPRASTPDLLPPLHTIDTASLATSETGGVVSEIKEWQAVMDHLRRLPVEPGAALPVLVIDGRATEVRAIAEG
jgi:5'-nucleotidase